MARHRSNFKKFLRDSKCRHTRSYDLFNEYGVENCKIELIEYFPCDTLQELRRREGEHIKNNECVNKYVAGRTDEEYKEHYTQYNKEEESFERFPKLNRKPYYFTLIMFGCMSIFTLFYFSIYIYI